MGIQRRNEIKPGYNVNIHIPKFEEPKVIKWLNDQRNITQAVLKLIREEVSENE